MSAFCTEQYNCIIWHLCQWHIEHYTVNDIHVYCMSLYSTSVHLHYYACYVVASEGPKNSHAESIIQFTSSATTEIEYKNKHIELNTNAPDTTCSTMYCWLLKGHVEDVTTDRVPVKSRSNKKLLCVCVCTCTFASRVTELIFKVFTSTELHIVPPLSMYSMWLLISTPPQQQT